MIKTLSASTAAAAIAALLLVVAAPTDTFAADIKVLSGSGVQP